MRASATPARASGTRTLAPTRRPTSARGARSPSASSSSPAVTSRYWPPTMPATPVAATSSPSAASRRGTPPLALAEMADPGEEAVAGQDRDVLPEDDVGRRSAPPQLVVVHRRQVVVDQRVGVDELDRGRGGQHLDRIHARGARGGEAQHGPDPLAAGEQRVAHRLAEARGRGAIGEPQARPGNLDQLAQVVGVRSPRVSPRRSRPRETPGRSRCRPGRPVRPPARQLGRLLVADLGIAQPLGDATQPSSSRTSAAGSAAASPPLARLLELARGRAEDPVDEPRRVGTAVLLRQVHRLVDRDLDRTRRDAASRRGRPA